MNAIYNPPKYAARIISDRKSLRVTDKVQQSSILIVP